MKKKEKLLYILPSYDSNTATHFLHTYEMIELLALKMDLFLLIEKPPITKPELKHINVRYQRFSNPILKLSERFLIIVEANLKGYKNCYVHYSYWGAIFSSLVSKLLGGKVFYWHCEWFEQFHSQWNLTKAGISKKLFDEFPLILTLKLVDQLITGSPTLKKFYIKTFSLSNSKVKVIPNWINLERFTISENSLSIKRDLGINKSKKIALFVHRLSPRKGITLLPEIINGVVRINKKLLFVVIGEGPSKNIFLKRIKELRLSDKVLYLGPIPNNKIKNYFSIADIFVMPSIQEGFPRVLLESMATGVPFVANDVGGTRDILSTYQKKYLVKSNDIIKFIITIQKIVNSPLEYQKLKKEGLEQVKKYSLKIISKKFIYLFSDSS